MSGWGCRYLYQEDCLLLRKGCKPGMPGCVLYKRVRFLAEIEQERAKLKVARRKKRH